MTALWLLLAMMPPAPAAAPLCGSQAAETCVIDSVSWKQGGRSMRLACVSPLGRGGNAERRARNILRNALTLADARTTRLASSVEGQRLAVLSYDGTNAARELLDAGLVRRADRAGGAPFCNALLKRQA